MEKNKKYIVKKSFAGLGLFATDDFVKGEFVIEYTGPLLTDVEADKKGGRYLFRIKKDKTIDGTGRANIARYVNHSHKPNCEALNEDDKRIIIQTKRKIRKGEELTYNYGQEYVEEFCDPCLCDSCRKS